MRWKRPESNIKSIALTLQLSHFLFLIFIRISEYVPELARAHAAREANLAAKKADSMNRMLNDLSVDKEANPGAFANDRWNPDEDDDMDGNNDDIDGEDNDLIDRSMLIILLS